MPGRSGADAGVESGLIARPGSMRGRCPAAGGGVAPRSAQTPLRTRALLCSRYQEDRQIDHRLMATHDVLHELSWVPSVEDGFYCDGFYVLAIQIRVVEAKGRRLGFGGATGTPLPPRSTHPWSSRPSATRRRSGTARAVDHRAPVAPSLARIRRTPAGLGMFRPGPGEHRLAERDC